ncbi:MAG: ATP-binding cassette domain-containing protein [Ekhidna sp.]
MHLNLFIVDMVLSAEDIGKKFGKNWIFRHLDFEIKKGRPCVIVGKNGSGKSTLLQIISGFLSPSFGKIKINNKIIDESDKSICLIGPYTELIEEYTLREHLQFHSQFKKALCSFEEMATSASLYMDKPILDFSTGMKQRVKLITCFFFENDIILMDEPTSNLDSEGIDWFSQELKKVEKNNLITIASNQKEEIVLCDQIIQLE